MCTFIALVFIIDVLYLLTGYFTFVNVNIFIYFVEHLGTIRILALKKFPVSGTFPEVGKAVLDRKKLKKCFRRHIFSSSSDWLINLILGPKLFLAD